MALRFVVHAVEATLAGGYFEQVVPGEQAVAGRGEDADITLPDPAASPRHLAVRVRDGELQVEDLGSRLGTRLNGRRLTAGKAVPLREADRLEAGPFLLQVTVCEQPVQQTGPLARELVRRLQQPVPARARPRSAGEGMDGVPCLRVLNGPAAGMLYIVPPGRSIRLGRGTQCEFVIDDARVSRVHALASNRAGCVWLEDSGSSNGIRVNGAPLRGARRLTPGCRIELGRVRLRLEADGGGAKKARSGLWLMTVAIGFGLGGLLVALGL